MLLCAHDKCKKEQDANIKFSGAHVNELWSYAAKASKLQGYVQSIKKVNQADANLRELQIKLEKQLEKYKNKLMGISHDLIYSTEPTAFHKCMAVQCRPEFQQMVSMVRAASKTPNQNNAVPLNNMNNNRIVSYYQRKYFQKQKDELSSDD